MNVTNSRERRSRETFLSNQLESIHVKSAKGEQREITDVTDGILYRPGPWLQFNVKDQIPSGSNLIL